ncbi:glutathione hydrolase 5 proenzyme-like [Agrilus planipennis]|uniref:Glutathione hydrolase 5 proenzyme-like n=1 Tax=Agrilus planipennis TaxID=224129 RepID=A0A1W4X6X8_AGRPL|nr:glutathione hydrolase 5 proenzyme-like [Agrilus planipennis]
MATVETREDLPLKKDGKRKGLNLCSEDFLGGSKLVNISLAVITIAITIALFFQISYGDYQIIPHGSVATDSKECSVIGTEIMKRGGNSVDAAIASMFCLSVVSPHIISLDGQGEAIIYNHKEQVPPVVISFNKNSASVSTLPNLVAGLSHLYLHYGKMNWKELIEPSVSLARNGFKISSHLAIAVRFLEAEKLFGVLKENNELKLEVLANTLEKFSSLTNDEIRNLIPRQNQPEITTTANMTFQYYNIFVPGGISEGPVLLHTLKRFQQENLTNSNSTIESEFIPKIAKINKMVHDELNMSDTFFKGTSTNVAVIDDNDLYISLVGFVFFSVFVFFCFCLRESAPMKGSDSCDELDSRRESAPNIKDSQSCSSLKAQN